MWHVPQIELLKCDLSGDGHVFGHFHPRFCPSTSPKQWEFGRYVKTYHRHISPMPLVPLASQITFSLWFICVNRRFDAFLTPFDHLFDPTDAHFDSIDQENVSVWCPNYILCILIGLLIYTLDLKVKTMKNSVYFVCNGWKSTKRA